MMFYKLNMTNTLQNKIEEARKEWQEFVEASLWQGEDEYTKNMPVGNVADWWIDKLSSIATLAQEEARKEIEKIILENSHEVYSGGNGFLQTNTDKVMLAIKDLSNNTLQ